MGAQAVGPLAHAPLGPLLALGVAAEGVGDGRADVLEVVPEGPADGAVVALQCLTGRAGEIGQQIQPGGG